MIYRLLIDFDVLEATLKLPQAQQRRLFRHLLAIKSFPGNYSDYVESDPVGRILNVSIFESFQIRYWVDDADSHIKILRLEKK